MRIAALTRFKHGALFELLQELGWTQAEFARRVGTTAQTIGDILNLTRRPSEELISKMEIAFGYVDKVVDVASFFPESFIGFKRSVKVIQIEDVEPRQLAEFARHQTRLLENAQPPLPSDIADTEDKLQQVFAMLEDTDGALTERERDVVRSTLLKNEPSSVIEERYGISHQMVYLVRDRALRKIRDHFTDPNEALRDLPSKEFIKAHSSFRTDEPEDEDERPFDFEQWKERMKERDAQNDPRRVGYEHLWTVEELAGDFNRCCETIRRWTKLGKIQPAVVIDGLALYDHAAVYTAWLKMNNLCL